MELRHLRYFVAVAEEKNFSRAAERLGIQQPPLSAQIRQLEGEVGVNLFRRLSRGVELTPAGKLFLENSRIILRQVEQAKLDATREARGESGKIAITGDGVCYLNPAIHLVVAELIRSFPDVVITTEETDTASLYAGIYAGKFDAAFVRAARPEAGLASEPVAAETAVVAFHEGTSGWPGEPATLALFSQHKLVLPSRAVCAGYYDAVLQSFRDAKVVPLFARPDAPSMIALLPMVATGYGAAIVPESFQRLSLTGVRYAPIEGTCPSMPVSLLYRNGEHSPPVRNLLAIIRRLAPGRSQVSQGQVVDIARQGTRRTR